MKNVITILLSILIFIAVQSNAAAGISLGEIREYLQIPDHISDDDLTFVLSLQADADSTYREAAEYIVSQTKLVEYYLSGEYINAINYAYEIENQFGDIKIQAALEILKYMMQTAGYTLA